MVNYNFLTKKEIFLLYVLSRQISLSIDRGLSNWTELKDFLSDVNINEAIDIINTKKSFFLSGKMINRGSLTLLKNRLNYLKNYLDFFEEPNKTDLIQLRLDIANVSSYLENKLPKRFKNIPIEHFNQSIPCKSINDLKNEFF